MHILNLKEQFNMKNTITASAIAIMGVIFLCAAMIGLCIGQSSEFSGLVLGISLFIGLAMFITGLICLLVEFAKGNK